MIRTYRAREVTLTRPVDIGPGRVSIVAATSVACLRVDPVSRQAFITRRDESEVLGVYDQAQLEQGEMQRMLEVPMCEVCGQTFESAQGLGKHRAHVHGGQAIVQGPRTVGKK